MSFERGQVHLPTGNVFHIEEYKDLDTMLARINKMMIRSLEERDSMIPSSARPILFTGAPDEAVDLPHATCSLVPSPTSVTGRGVHCQRAVAQPCAAVEVDAAIAGVLPTLVVEAVEILPSSCGGATDCNYDGNCAGAGDDDGSYDDDDDDDDDDDNRSTLGSSRCPSPSPPSCDGDGDGYETARERCSLSPPRAGRGGDSTDDARGRGISREEAALRLRVQRALLRAPDGDRRR